MTMNVFKRALNKVKEERLRIYIGGGEPTIHPKFMDMLWYAVSFSKEHKLSIPWMVTNGSRTKIALQLAEMARNGTIECELSLDEYHSEISEEVKNEFRKSQNVDNLQSIRTAESIMSHGRGVKLYRDYYGSNPKRNKCCCQGPFTKPNGDILQCGCHGAKKIASVWTRMENFPSKSIYRSCSFGLEQK
jgi:hypothetical protein